MELMTTKDLSKRHIFKHTHMKLFNRFPFSSSRTPGSRQPSPAEEQLPRASNLLDAPSHHNSGFPQHHHSLHHMLGSAAAAAAAAAAAGVGTGAGANDIAQQAAAAALGSYHHPQMINQMNQMNQLNQMNQMSQLNQMQSHVMNGVGGIPQITQVSTQLLPIERMVKKC